MGLGTAIKEEAVVAPFQADYSTHRGIFKAPLAEMFPSHTKVFQFRVFTHTGLIISFSSHIETVGEPKLNFKKSKLFS